MGDRFRRPGKPSFPLFGPRSAERRRFIEGAENLTKQIFLVGLLILLKSMLLFYITPMDDFASIINDQLKQLKEAVRKRGRVNLLVAGKTGVGKSTLINAVFQGNFASTGHGRPATKNTRKIKKKGSSALYFRYPRPRAGPISGISRRARGPDLWAGPVRGSERPYPLRLALHFGRRKTD